MIKDIYNELKTCADSITKMCDEFQQKVVKIQENPEIGGFEKNKSLCRDAKTIQNNLSLMRNFFALWNISDDDAQTLILDAVDSAVGQYRHRRGSDYPFQSIIKHINCPSSLLPNDKSEEEQKELRKKIVSDFFKDIRGNMLSLVPYILLDNATKYAKRESQIVVTIKLENENKGEIIVENIGPIIEDTAAIFNPKTRGDNARKMRPHLGSGNGLAFAEKILTEYGCEIDVSQSGDVEVYNDISYRKIEFKVTFDKAKMFNTPKNQIQNSDYYEFVDEMFNHEYFNVCNDLLWKSFAKIERDLTQNYRNLNLSTSEANLLKAELDKFSPFKVKLMFILSKYVYRNDNAIPDNRLVDGVYWTQLYQDVARLYENDFKNANIRVDTKVEVPVHYGFMVRRQRTSLDEYNQQRLLISCGQQPPIQNLEIVKDIPLLVYDLILNLSGEGNVVNITLSPATYHGCHMWHNEIEIEVYDDNHIATIERIINHSERVASIESMSPIELLLRMLQKYLAKINGQFRMGINRNNNRFVLEFTICNND